MQAKSTADHKRDGTYRTDRHSARLDLKMTAKAPTKPRNLDKVASKCWDTICAAMPEGALSPADGPALELAAIWFSRWRRFNAELDAGGDSYKLTTLLAVASKHLGAAISALGLSPAARSRIKIATESEAPKYDPLAKIIAMRTRQPG